MDNDNPTIGLVLCTAKNDKMAKYMLGDNAKKIFASTYQFHLPTEKELETELVRGIAKNETYDEQPLIDLDSETIDFRVVSEQFSHQGVSSEAQYLLNYSLRAGVSEKRNFTPPKDWPPPAPVLDRKK